MGKEGNIPASPAVLVTPPVVLPTVSVTPFVVLPTVSVTPLVTPPTVVNHVSLANLVASFNSYKKEEIVPSS